MATPSTSSETSLQSFIHALEQGRLAGLVRIIVLIVVVLGISLVYLGWNFSGFALPEAMDHAQVGRQIASGHGFTTKLIRPLAIWQIERNLGGAPKGLLPDTVNAPVQPLIDSVAVKLTGMSTEIKRGEGFPMSERVIVIFSMVFFWVAVGVNYLILARLFDSRLAFMASLLVLGTDLLWQFTLSGLPQMFMLMIFSLALYTLVRAMDAHAAPEGTAKAVLGWLAITGALLGVLALCHGLATAIAAGAITFSLFHFRRRGPMGLVLLVTFAAVWGPWLVRTYSVSGNPFGLAGYQVFDGLGGSTWNRMRSPSGPGLEDIQIHFFRLKIQHGIAQLLEQLSQNLGSNLVALGFFVSLLYPFRKRTAVSLRWAAVVMWLFLMLGTSILGPDKAAVGANQLGVLFLPLMLGIGLAFALVLFSRMENSTKPAMRLTFWAGIFAVTLPGLLFTLLPERKPGHQYPPYFPPSIKALGDWVKDKEIIASDMPWAVAWYADRKSLWLPTKERDLMGLSDEGKLSGDLAGMFLTPISRNASFISGIYRGDYQEYAQLIFGNTNVPYFPFREAVLMMGDLNYTFYGATRRWEKTAPAE